MLPPNLNMSVAYTYMHTYIDNYIQTLDKTYIKKKKKFINYVKYRHEHTSFILFFFVFFCIFFVFNSKDFWWNIFVAISVCNFKPATVICYCCNLSCTYVNMYIHTYMCGDCCFLFFFCLIFFFPSQQP